MPRHCWSFAELLLATLAVALLSPILVKIVIALNAALGAHRP